MKKVHTVSGLSEWRSPSTQNLEQTIKTKQISSLLSCVPCCLSGGPRLHETQSGLQGSLAFPLQPLQGKVGKVNTVVGRGRLWSGSGTGLCLSMGTWDACQASDGFLQLTKYVCVFFMEEGRGSKHHHCCLNCLTSDINRHEYLLQISTFRRHTPIGYDPLPQFIGHSMITLTLQSKRSGYERGPN